MRRKHILVVVPFMFIFCFLSHLQAQTLDECLQQAEALAAEGDFEGAITLMKKAVETFPEDPTAHAFLGSYLTRSAGASDDMMVKASRSGQAFEQLDTAVRLDSTNVYARFFRGLLGVMVPPFLGRLDQGIKDLETVIGIAQTEPDQAPQDIVTQTYNYLGLGYSNREEQGKARQAWEEVLQRAPGSDQAKEAQAHLDELAAQTSAQPARPEPEGQAPRGDIQKAREAIDRGEQDKAVLLLERMVAEDSTDALALAYLGLARAMSGGAGYDERIAGDTNLRTNAALEGYAAVEKAVMLAPDDPEVRLVRGMFGAELPSFMGKTDQAVEDLHYVLESTSPQDLKAEALYSLGVAYRRKGLSAWEELVTNYPQSETVRRAREQMKPAGGFVEPGEMKPPLVTVRFTIGFETELEPQTAVWIENEQGQCVKTIYVSAFSGYVRDTQVVLPKWAKASNFETDANTAASIAAGWHSFIWDLTDHDGHRVGSGPYVVKVEIHHWPSLQYQLASATVEVDGRENVSRAETGDLVPFLEVRYVPE